MAPHIRWTSGFSAGCKQYLHRGPAPVFMAMGMGGSGHGQYEVADDEEPIMEDKSKTAKPPYAVPLWADTERTRTCGYTEVSTFSGGGGSCAGDRMAGFEVLWANEFVPSAQDSYLANHKRTLLDCRPIQNVTVEDILAATGLKVGELDMLDGSPPCQKFSIAGQREKGWGKAREYAGTGFKQCDEELFNEYIRLLKGLQPKVFKAENVKGLTIGAAKAMMGNFQMDIFDKQDDTILHGLMDAGYVVRWRVLNAMYYRVPQSRSRVFFVGVRKDLARLVDMDGFWPRPEEYVYTIRDALPELYAPFKVTQHGGLYGGAVREHEAVEPSPTITSRQNANMLRVEMGSAPHGRTTGDELHPDEPAPTVTTASPGNDMAAPPLPNPGDISIAKHGYNRTFDGPDRPSQAIVVGARTNGEVVDDQAQRRKFTIPEVKRLCAFPDDYVLVGSYGKQWAVCGNSVPPLMSCALSVAIRDNLLAKVKPIQWRDDPRPEGRALHRTTKAAPAAKAEKPAKWPKPAEPEKTKVTGEFKYDDYWRNRFK